MVRDAPKTETLPLRIELNCALHQPRPHPEERRSRVSKNAASGDALLEAVADGLLGQFAADEDETALARLAVFPGALVIAFQHHVHALKHVTIVVVAEGENSLRAQDLLALAGDEVLQPGHEFGGIERLIRPQRQRLHVLVMIVLQAAMAMIVIMVVIVTVMVMMIVAVAGIEKFRLDFQN